MTLDKSLLYHFIQDSLVDYSEEFRVRERGNPVMLDLNGMEYSVHVSYVHDSGNTRTNDDEVRIQISKSMIDLLKVRFKEGKKVAFAGFFEMGKVFVAWDPLHVFSLQTSSVASIYARKSQEKIAGANSASVHKFRAKFLQENSFAIALPFQALGFYLENFEKFHRLRSEESIRKIVNDQKSDFANGNLAVTGSVEVDQDGQRERFTYTRKTFPRDPNFRNEVLAAYDRTCCICQRQLAIVQAAHIIPHSEPDSPNNVANGLGLCIEHHRLYDDALLLPGPDRKLFFNGERAAFLRQTNQWRGLDDIEAKHESEYTVPSNREHRPSEEYLQRGLEIRMGS